MVGLPADSRLAAAVFVCLRRISRVEVGSSLIKREGTICYYPSYRFDQ